MCCDSQKLRLRLRFQVAGCLLKVVIGGRIAHRPQCEQGNETHCVTAGRIDKSSVHAERAIHSVCRDAVPLTGERRNASSVQCESGLTLHLSPNTGCAVIVSPNFQDTLSGIYYHLTRVYSIRTQSGPYSAHVHVLCDAETWVPRAWCPKATTCGGRGVFERSHVTSKPCWGAEVGGVSSPKGKQS